MRLRRLSLFPLAALLGAAVVVLPALAASESKTIEAAAPGCDSYWPTYACWTPLSVTISSGGVVKFVNSGTLEQEVKWTGPATPACENVPSTKQKGPWEGSCTFTQPGTYSFQGADFYVTGHVTVTASGTTSTGTTGITTGTTTGTPTTTSTQPKSSGSGTTPSGSGSPTQAGGPSGGAGPLGSLFVGSASSAVKLAPAQHGQSVHGSVDVSQAAAGGRLEVQLLATRASLASAGHQSRVRVGRVVHARLHAGTATFTVTLDAKARRALRARGHLALRVAIALTPAHGATVTITRSVVVRG